MAKAARKTKVSAMRPDWSQLPEELLHLIIKNLDNCFDVVHARSVSRSWRSSFPFPSCLLRPSYSLPSFTKFPVKNKELCTLEKVHLFLFRVRSSAAVGLPFEYFLGGVGQDKSNKDHPSPLQCSVKVEIPGSDPTLMNMVDCQILSLGYQYRMIGWDPNRGMGIGYYRGVVFLPLHKEGEFVVILDYSNVLLVLTRAEMKWKRLKNVPDSQCMNLVTFRGRFYATFLNNEIVVIDPHSLEVTLLMPEEPLPFPPHHSLVPCGNDELFLVEEFNPFPEAEVLDFNRFTCRVSKLDEKTNKWVEVTDLEDRVLFIGQPGNSSWLGKELLDGCGVSGNSIVNTNCGNVSFPYKYGVDTGREEDKLNIWRYSREKLVTNLNTFPVVALKFECHVD